MAATDPQPRLGRSASLNRRLVGLLLAVGLLPLLAVAAVNHVQSRRALAQQVQSQLTDLAAASSDKLDRTLANRYSDTRAFASSDAARVMDPLRLIPLMTRMTVTYAPHYRLMLVADRDGRILAANRARPDGRYLDGASLLGASVAGERWFEVWRMREMRMGATYVEGVHVDRRVARLYGDQGYVIGFSHGIFDQTGSWTGVWLNLFDWNTATQILEEFEQRPHRQGMLSIRLTIANKDGLILAGAEPHNVLQTHYQRFIDDDLVVGQAVSEGYGPYQGLGWRLIATQARDEALLVVRQLTLRTLLAAAVSAVLVVLVGIIAARTVTRPVRALQAASEQVARGMLHVRVPDGDDELGQLGSAFNSMTAQLRSLYSSLEDQVARRTAELAATLDDLQRSTAELLASREELAETNATLAHSEARYRQLFKQSQTMLAETQALYQIARSLIRAESLPDLLQAVVDGAAEALPADAVVLALYNLDSEHVLHLVAGGSAAGRLKPAQLDMLCSRLGPWLLREHGARLCSISQADTQPGQELQQLRASLRMSSLLVAPLSYRDTTLGAMVALNGMQQREFTRRDVELMTAMANQATLAIENAWLYSAAQQELAERRRAEEELRRYQEHLEEQVEARTAQLQQLAAELSEKNRRLRQGLELAREIQLGLLPARVPWQPQLVAVQARSLPALEVGGDFYAFMPSREQHQGALAIGDVSGKGVGAALMMALVSSAVETQQRRGLIEPGPLLTRLNAQLAPRLRANRMNAGLQIVKFDLQQRRLFVANAGMIPPLLLRNGSVSFIEAYGLPLGGLPHTTYHEVALELRPGDLIVLISDGVVEAHNSERELFGFERLFQLLSQYRHATRLEQLIDEVLVEVSRFSGNSEQHDDMTVLAALPRLDAL